MVVVALPSVILPTAVCSSSSLAVATAVTPPIVAATEPENTVPKVAVDTLVTPLSVAATSPV